MAAPSVICCIICLLNYNRNVFFSAERTHFSFCLQITKKKKATNFYAQAKSKLSQDLQVEGITYSGSARGTCPETGLFFKLLKLIARYHINLQLPPTHSSFTLYKIRNFPRFPCSLNLTLPSLPPRTTKRGAPLAPTLP